MHQSTCHHQDLPVVSNSAGDVKPLGFSATVTNWLSNLWRRNKLMSLEKLDDHMLDDIGITRSDLGWARRLPLSSNPLAALDDLARSRSRARRLGPGRRLPGSRAI